MLVVAGLVLPGCLALQLGAGIAGVGGDAERDAALRCSFPLGDSRRLSTCPMTPAQTACWSGDADACELAAADAARDGDLESATALLDRRGFHAVAAVCNPEKLAEWSTATAVEKRDLIRRCHPGREAAPLGASAAVPVRVEQTDQQGRPSFLFGAYFELYPDSQAKVPETGAGQTPLALGLSFGAGWVKPGWVRITGLVDGALVVSSSGGPPAPPPVSRCPLFSFFCHDAPPPTPTPAPPPAVGALLGIGIDVALARYALEPFVRWTYHRLIASQKTEGGTLADDSWSFALGVRLRWVDLHALAGQDFAGSLSFGFGVGLAYAAVL